MKERYTKEFISKYFNGDWMSEDQLECTRMLFDIMGGDNHTFGTIKPSGKGIVINLDTNTHIFSTHNGWSLTRAVLMAHDRAIRFQIKPSWPGMLRLFFHKRKRNETLSDSHPTIKEAINKYEQEFKT